MFSLLKKYRAKLPLIVDMLFSILVFPFGFTFLEKLFLLAEKPNDPGFQFLHHVMPEKSKRRMRI